MLVVWSVEFAKGKGVEVTLISDVNSRTFVKAVKLPEIVIGE